MAYYDHLNFFSSHRNQNRLGFDALKQILREQIAGIEVYEEAARITAFSLYLALLPYLDPPAITEQIKQGNKLPNLLVSENKSTTVIVFGWGMPLIRQRLNRILYWLSVLVIIVRILL